MGKAYYHVTFVATLSKIRRDGIVPGKRRNWNNAFGSKLGSTKNVYVFSDPVSAARWAFKMEWEFEKPAVIIVLKDIDPASLVDDTGAEPHQFVDGEQTWKCTADTIPASCIDRVVPMSQDIARAVVKFTNGESKTFEL